MHCWPCICWWRWGWRRWRQPGWCWLSTLLVSLEGIQMRFSSPIASTTASSSSTSLSSASAIVISIGKGGVAAIKRWSSSVSWKREPGKETEVIFFVQKWPLWSEGKRAGAGEDKETTQSFVLLRLIICWTIWGEKGFHTSGVIGLYSCALGSVPSCAESW